MHSFFLCIWQRVAMFDYSIRHLLFTQWYYDIVFSAANFTRVLFTAMERRNSNAPTRGCYNPISDDGVGVLFINTTVITYHMHSRHVQKREVNQKVTGLHEPPLYIGTNGKWNIVCAFHFVCFVCNGLLSFILRTRWWFHFELNPFLSSFLARKNAWVGSN